MKSQIILFIFFLQFNQFQLNNDFPQIIIIEKQPRDEFPNIPIQYSTQPKTYCFHINTALQFNWASPSDFNISKVPSIQIYPTITKQIGSSFHNITPIIDNLKLNNITIKNFHCLDYFYDFNTMLDKFNLGLFEHTPIVLNLNMKNM